jgi:hypothetical protein
VGGTVLEGAIIATAGLLLGRLTAYLPPRRRTPKPAPAPRPICGCGHHYSFHQDGRECKDTNRRTVYSKVGHDCGKRDFPCTCVQYTGPLPVPEFFAAEITGA